MSEATKPVISNVDIERAYASLASSLMFFSPRKTFIAVEHDDQAEVIGAAVKPPSTTTRAGAGRR